jgi:small GTP-binding protein
MIVESTGKTSLPGKTGGAYGVRTLRQLRRNNQEPSERLRRKIDTTYSYFLEEVDPVIGDVITHLLCEQPVDVPGATLSYLTKKQEEARKAAEAAQAIENDDVDVQHREATKEVAIEEVAAPVKVNKRPKKEAKLYLALSIGPIITKLVNRIAVTRPKKVMEFMCEELETMIYGGDEEERKEVETDERFAMYKGMDGPREETEGVVEVQVENPPAQSLELEESVPEVSTGEPQAAVVATEEPTTTVEVTVEVKPQSIQFAVLGMDGAGKSAIVNMLQGQSHVAPKPTIGFRPVSLMLDENTTIRFYDVGGGKRVRGIWEQYYHDVHAVIYVVDLTEKDEMRLEECKKLFQASISHSFIADKPLLVLGNKADKEGAMSVTDLEAMLDLAEIKASNNNVQVALSSAPVQSSDSVAEADPRVEAKLEDLIKVVQEDFIALNDRVIVDTEAKGKEDQKKRLARERKVLKNKMILAFADSVKEEFKPDETDLKKSNSEDSFTQEEGLSFLGAELGEEVSALPSTALEIASMVGYQRLALQIVGSLKVPISKKKDPMEWTEIHSLIVEIREELGLA